MTDAFEDDDAGNVADEVDAGNMADDDEFDDDAGNRIDDNTGNQVDGGRAGVVLEYITRSIATEPDSVVIDTDDSGRTTRFRIHVAPGDMGRMIGRRGRVAQAIRTMVRVAGSRDHMDTSVDFVDD